MCAVLDTEKSASGQSPTQYLSDFCNTILLQNSLKYSGFINPFRTTRCSPKGMKPAAVSVLSYEILTEQPKLWDWFKTLRHVTLLSWGSPLGTSHRRTCRGSSTSLILHQPMLAHAMAAKWSRTLACLSIFSDLGKPPHPDLK